VIATVTNQSRDFSYAMFDVSMAYRESIDRVGSVIQSVGASLQADPSLGHLILEPVQILGVDQWADSAVILRCRMKVIPAEQGTIRRAFLGRLKTAFDEPGIEIPFPCRTVYSRSEP